MKYKNPMAFHQDIASKRRAFRLAAAQGCIAWDKNGCEHLLRNLNIDDVEYIGGAWRVQNKFEHKIQLVRGEQFVLGEKLNRAENNHFEFYRAHIVGKNCYGYYLVNNSYVIVAKYETDDETFWAYGHTIEQARAFLGIRLYDKYQDAIHAHLCRKKLANEK